MKLDEVITDIEGFFKKYLFSTYRVTSSVEGYVTRLYEKVERDKLPYQLNLTIETNLTNIYKRKSLDELKNRSTLELKDKTWILEIKKNHNEYEEGKK